MVAWSTFDEMAKQRQGVVFIPALAMSLADRVNLDNIAGVTTAITTISGCIILDVDN